MDLTGKNAVVTGASQGLGAVVASALAAAGARVFVNYAHGAQKAAAVVAEIRAAGGQAEEFGCDVADEKQVGERFARLEAESGGIDVLINNARLDPYARKPEHTDGEWFDRTLAVNLKGAYLTSLAVLDGMKARGWGRIVNVSSVWADRPATRRLIPYSVSKAGMHALTRACAREGAPQVTVNTVAPGLILTENAAVRLTAEQLAAETADIPLQRGATPEEIAGVILQTLENGFITGETIRVNGGVWMGN